MRNLLDHGLLERFTIISLGLREYAPKATDLAASLETVHAVLERARGVKRLELKSLWQVDPMVLVSEGLKGECMRTRENAVRRKSTGMLTMTFALSTGVEHFDMNKSCFALPDPSSSPPTLHWPLQTFDLAPHHTNPPNLPPLILTSLHSLRYKSTYSTDPPSLPTLLSSLLPLVGPSLQTLTLDYYHPQTPLAFTPHISSLSSLKNLIFISKHFTPHSLSRFLEALIPPQTRLKTLKINLSASQVPMFLHSLKSLEALRELKLLQVGLESLALANVEERLPPSAIALVSRLGHRSSVERLVRMFC